MNRDVFFFAAKINPNQSTLPNATSAMSNRPNFGEIFERMEVIKLYFVDQLTTNVPQGAKRLDEKMKVSIKVDDEFEEDQSKEIDMDSV